MNRESQSHVGLFQVFVVLGVLVFFACQSFAGVSSIYKWKDEQGKTHFTDDPLKIPLRYRSDPNLEKVRGLPSPIPSSRKQMSKSNAYDPVEDQKEQEIKNADSETDKMEKELVAMQAALSFLKSDIQRFKKFEDYYPMIRSHRVLKIDIIAALPEKKALEENLEPYDSALLQEIKSFLKKSLLLDDKAKDLWPRNRSFANERIRIREEGLVKSRLVEKLQAEIKITPEKESTSLIIKYSVANKKTLKKNRVGLAKTKKH
jgi:hypothetical protein